MECKLHEIQNILQALDELGQVFGFNRDIWYTLGRYLGYTDLFLSQIESQKDTLSWILCWSCTSMEDMVKSVSTLEH